MVERRLGRLSHQDVRDQLLEVALVIDDRTEQLADKDQAADGWREWLRISNALNLREQPTIVTALTDASVHGVADQAEHETVPDRRCRTACPSGSLRMTSTISGAEQTFIEKLARYATRDTARSIAVPVVGYEAERRHTHRLRLAGQASSRLPGPRRR